jgi:Mg2+-importing ATPase
MATISGPDKSSASTPNKAGQPVAQETPAAYWSLAPEQLLSALHASRDGLQPSDAEQRLKQYGLNTIGAQQQATAVRLLLSQFKSPLVLILIFAAIVSGVVGEWIDASIVLPLCSSTILGFVQEYTASNAIEKLRSQVTIKSSLRGVVSRRRCLPNKWCPAMWCCSLRELIPADGIVLEATTFYQPGGAYRRNIPGREEAGDCP